MVILGLGSNIGHRLENLRHAYHLLKKTPGIQVQQVSPVYISDALLPDHADDSWNTPFLNLAIRCETSLAPYELLEKTKHIEKQLGRNKAIDWSPRIIDIDILAWDNLIKYDDKLHVPHEHLHERPFALLPLADVAPFWMYPLPGPFHGKTALELSKQWDRMTMPLHTRQISQRIDTPSLMGIVNITPDSFSDGGKCMTPESAFQHIEKLVKDGAEIIDLGAESTGPKSTSLNPKEEWHRLEPVLAMLKNTHLVLPPKISIDTRHTYVAEKCLEVGVDWINDVSGLDDPAMRDLLKNADCRIVFMHHLGIPAHPSVQLPLHENPVLHVYSWAEQRLNTLNISPDRLIFDVGIGYGKNAQQSLHLIQHISEFKKLGVALLVAHSRKSFLSQFTHLPAAQRDIETMAISHYLDDQAIDFLRIHEVEYLSRLLKVKKALVSAQ